MAIIINQTLMIYIRVPQLCQKTFSSIMTYDGGDEFKIHHKKKTFSQLFTYVFAINHHFCSRASKSQGL